MRQLAISSDPATLAETVATALVQRLASIQAEGRIPSLALTGGTIAAEVYRSAAALASTDLDSTDLDSTDLDSTKLDWAGIDFWWGDERYVPADSADRNDREVGLALLDTVGVDPARVHAMPAADEVHVDVATAAAAYDAEVRAHGGDGFDLVLLGLGPDGHVASLFPGSPQLMVEDAFALPVANSPKPPPERITLTLSALNRTREVWFLVSGAEKADAVARALADAGSVQDTPARGITCDEVTWHLDRAAASAL